MSSNFACQACSFETTIAGHAETHERRHEGHEVFEFFQPIDKEHDHDN